MFNGKQAIHKNLGCYPLLNDYPLLKEKKFFVTLRTITQILLTRYSSSTCHACCAVIGRVSTPPHFAQKVTKRVMLLTVNLGFDTTSI
jgi:hypothetical protein